MFNQLKKELKSITSEKPNLPELPKKFKPWSLHARPIIEGRKRSFQAIPFWERIYEDEQGFIMIVGGRQIFKSTYFGDRLAFVTTTKPGVTSLYVTHDDENLSAFSNDKFRVAVFDDNPLLRSYVKGSTIGQVHRISLKNGSKIYLVTDERGFKHTEGKSPDEVILDEGQYLELENWTRIREAMATTQGKIKVGGIGGERGSPYYNFWKTTNQMEWYYDDQYWRTKLEFNSDGLIIDDYLIDVLAGHWEAREPENYQRHGYHLPQTIFPHIPLTIEEAENKYHIDREYSIEFKQLEYPQTLFQQHVMGEFYEGTKRPITREMVLACMRPYQYLELWSPDDVVTTKNVFGRDIRVLMGVDFGSGNVGASKTVASIMIKWKARPELGFTIPRYQLVFVSDNPPRNEDDQAEWLALLCKQYQVDAGVGDLGYGASIVKKIQQGGRNRETGAKYDGVGRRIFNGCWTRQAVDQALKDKKPDSDEEGKKEGHLLIDKTQSIQLFIDFLQRYTQHPHRKEEWLADEPHINNHECKWARPQLIIPYRNQRKVSWLIREFTSIERKDIEETDIPKPDKREQARKLFNHPPDAVMSIIYCLVADENYDEDVFKIHPIGR